MDVTHFIFILIAFLASFVSAVFGIGTALLVLAVGSHLLPADQAIALATVLFTTSTLSKSVIFAKHINWRVAATVALASLPFAFLGAMLMAQLPIDILKRCLALMILLYLLTTRFNLVPTFKQNQAAIIAGSAAYGFLSGLLGSGNIVKAILFRQMQFTKQTFVGTMAASSVLSNIAKLTAYSQARLLGQEHVASIVALILVALLAALIGAKLLRRIPIKHFELGIQIILAISAISLLV